MIGIAEDDLRFDVFFQLAPLHAFDCSGCAYRHKNRRQDIAMVGMNDAGTRSDGSRSTMEFEEGQQNVKSLNCYILLLTGKTMAGLKVWASSGVMRA